MELRAQLKAQYENVLQLNCIALEIGDTWSVMSARWVKLWKHYVTGAVSGDLSKLGIDENFPGPIDNFDILDSDGKLKAGQLVDRNYVIMHLEAWELLAEYYKTKQPLPILRKVIEKGQSPRTLEIEVYSLDRELAQAEKPSETVRREFSMASQSSEVEATTRSLVGVPGNRESRFDRLMEALGETSADGQWQHVELTERSMSSQPIVQSKNDDLKAELKAQYEKVRQLNASALVKGDTWAVVSIRWVKLWKEYVGADTYYAYKLADENYHPGPIDNSDLLESDGRMRDGRLAEMDYAFMHKEAWELLAEYYKTKQAEPILRKVIEKGKFARTLEIEVYLLDLKLAQFAKPDATVSQRFSRACQFSEVEATMRSLFEVPEGSETRLWVSLSGTSYDLLTDKDQALENQVYNNQYLLLEVKGTDGLWPRGGDSKSFCRSPATSTSSYLLGTGGQNRSSKMTILRRMGLQ